MENLAQAFNYESDTLVVLTYKETPICYHIRKCNHSDNFTLKGDNVAAHLNGRHNGEIFTRDEAETVILELTECYKKTVKDLELSTKNY